MAISKLQIIIEAIDNASETLSGVGKSFEATSKDFTKFGAGITAGGAVLTGFLAKTGLTAARVEVLGTVLKSIGRVSGISNDVLAEQEKTIKKLGITTRSARELMIKFMQSQLDVADASKVARVAQDLAVISGQNSSQAAETLTNAIVSQNTVLLKQFGIVQNLNTIYDNYAEALGKSVDELTDVEKKQAFLNVILEEGEKVAGTYEAAMGDVGKQMSSLARLTEEAEVAFGEAFLPVMEKVVQGLTGMLKAYLELSPEQQNMITQVTMIVAGLSLVTGPLLLLIGSLPKVAAGFAIIKGPLGWVILAITALTGVIAVLYSNWDKITTFIRNSTTEITRSISGSIASIVAEFNYLKDMVGSIFGWIGDQFWNVVHALDAMILGVGSVGSAIGRFLMGGPLIERKEPSFLRKIALGFQDGGIVPGPTGQAVPAIVHGGETIIPAGKGLGTINVYVQGGNYLDRDAGKKFAEILGKMLRRELRY